MKYKDTLYEAEEIIPGVESFYDKKTSGIRVLKRVAKRLSEEAKEEGVETEDYFYYYGKESWALAVYELGIEGQGMIVAAKKIIARKYHRYIFNHNLQEEFNLHFDIDGSVTERIAA